MLCENYISLSLESCHYHKMKPLLPIFLFPTVLVLGNYQYFCLCIFIYVSTFLINCMVLWSVAFSVAHWLQFIHVLACIETLFSMVAHHPIMCTHDLACSLTSCWTFLLLPMPHNYEAHCVNSKLLGG